MLVTKPSTRPGAAIFYTDELVTAGSTWT